MTVNLGGKRRSARVCVALATVSALTLIVAMRKPVQRSVKYRRKGMRSILHVTPRSGAERRCGHDRHVHFFRSDFAPVCVSLKQNKRKTFAAELVVLTGLRTHTAKTVRTDSLLLTGRKNRSEPFLVFFSHFDRVNSLFTTIRFALSHRFRAHHSIMAGKASPSFNGRKRNEIAARIPRGELGRPFSDCRFNDENMG